jgi:ferredoxin
MTLPCLDFTQKPRIRATKPGSLKASQCNPCALEPEVLVKCCATCYPCIFICNSNAIQDDTWDLLIDGTLVGQHAAGNEYRATIVLPDLFTGKTINGHTGRGCNIFTWINTTALDTIKNKYILNMRLAVIMGSGNLGTVQILCARPEIDDTVTLMPTPGGTFTYTDPDPYVVGTSVRYPLRFRRA